MVHAWLTKSCEGGKRKLQQVTWRMMCLVDYSHVLKKTGSRCPAAMFSIVGTSSQPISPSSLVTWLVLFQVPTSQSLSIVNQAFHLHHWLRRWYVQQPTVHSSLISHSIRKSVRNQSMNLTWWTSLQFFSVIYHLCISGSLFAFWTGNLP
jgi:fumarate reductase subunit C